MLDIANWDLRGCARFRIMAGCLEIPRRSSAPGSEGADQAGTLLCQIPQILFPLSRDAELLIAVLILIRVQVESNDPRPVANALDPFVIRRKAGESFV